MRRSKKGFTLVELNLAIIFVSILILGIAMTTIYISRMYQQGITVKSVNQVGREVSGQIRSDFSAARPDAVDSVSTTSGNGAIISGRVCLGTVSYLYNTAVGLNTSPNLLRDQSGQPITFVRVDDTNADWCKRNGGGAFLRDQVTAADDPTELLATDDIPLAIHDITVESVMADSGTGINQAMYRVAALLGTNQLGTTDNGRCLPPTENQSNFENCFVAEFDMIVRSGELSG